MQTARPRGAGHDARCANRNNGHRVSRPYSGIQTPKKLKPHWVHPLIPRGSFLVSPVVDWGTGPPPPGGGVGPFQPSRGGSPAPQGAAPSPHGAPRKKPRWVITVPRPALTAGPDRSARTTRSARRGCSRSAGSTRPVVYRPCRTDRTARSVLPGSTGAMPTRCARLLRAGSQRSRRWTGVYDAGSHT